MKKSSDTPWNLITASILIAHKMEDGVIGDHGVNVRRIVKMVNGFGKIDVIILYRYMVVINVRARLPEWMTNVFTSAHVLLMAV